MSTTAIKERPILFSNPMVRAIMEGRKTQTRRVVKGITDPESFEVLGDSGAGFLHSDKCQSFCDYACGGKEVECPYGKRGDRLWVREACRITSQADDDGGPLIEPAVWYEADGECPNPSAYMHKRPSIHMPRWASRLTLEITDVRVERLHSIAESDAIAEGCGGPGYGTLALLEYSRLWDEINGKGAWAMNPWVWVVEFRGVNS